MRSPSTSHPSLVSVTLDFASLIHNHHAFGCRFDEHGVYFQTAGEPPNPDRSYRPRDRACLQFTCESEEGFQALSEYMRTLTENAWVNYNMQWDGEPVRRHGEKAAIDITPLLKAPADAVEVIGIEARRLGWRRAEGFAKATVLGGMMATDGMRRLTEVPRNRHPSAGLIGAIECSAGITATSAAAPKAAAEYFNFKRFADSPALREKVGRQLARLPQPERSR